MLIGFTAIILINSYMLPNISGHLLYNDINKPAIALTFDDGPLPATTLPLLDILKENDVKATFFVLGEMAERYPEIVKRITDDGHQIGNHTENHRSLFNLNKAGIKSQIESCQTSIINACGQTPTIFRPPQGDTNANLTELIKNKMNLTSYLWDIDPKDWKVRNAPLTVQYVLQNTHKNNIILLHDIQPETIKAVPEIIRGLSIAGYRFVTCNGINN